MILILGFLFLVFFFAVVILAAGFFTVFVNPWSLLLVTVPLLFFLVISKSGTIIGKYIVSSFKKDYPYTKTELAGLSNAVKNTIKFILATGCFSFLMFVIVCLGHLGAPEKLGPSIAICLTVLTYSVGVSFFVFYPLQVWAVNRINSLKDDI